MGREPSVRKLGAQVGYSMFCKCDRCTTGNSASVGLVAAWAILSPALRPDVARHAQLQVREERVHTNHKDSCVLFRLVFCSVFFERSDSSIETSRFLHDIPKDGK